VRSGDLQRGAYFVGGISFRMETIFEEENDEPEDLIEMKI
jgi:hypothetical protein